LSSRTVGAGRARTCKKHRRTCKRREVNESSFHKDLEGEWFEKAIFAIGSGGNAAAASVHLWHRDIKPRHGRFGPAFPAIFTICPWLARLTGSPRIGQRSFNWQSTAFVRQFIPASQVLSIKELKDKGPSI
jgi:hypothetical protein